MEGPKGFSEIWTDAHRERGEFIWSIIARLMATSRRAVPRPDHAHEAQPVYGTLVKVR